MRKQHKKRRWIVPVTIVIVLLLALGTFFYAKRQQTFISRILDVLQQNDDFNSIYKNNVENVKGLTRINNLTTIEDACYTLLPYSNTDHTKKCDYFEARYYDYSGTDNEVAAIYTNLQKHGWQDTAFLWLPAKKGDDVKLFTGDITAQQYGEQVLFNSKYAPTNGISGSPSMTYKTRKDAVIDASIAKQHPHILVVSLQKTYTTQ